MSLGRVARARDSVCGAKKFIWRFVEIIINQMQRIHLTASTQCTNTLQARQVCARPDLRPYRTWNMQMLNGTVDHTHTHTTNRLNTTQRWKRVKESYSSAAAMHSNIKPNSEHTASQNMRIHVLNSHFDTAKPRIFSFIFHLVQLMINHREQWINLFKFWRLILIRFERNRKKMFEKGYATAAPVAIASNLMAFRHMAEIRNQ